MLGLSATCALGSAFHSDEGGGGNYGSSQNPMAVIEPGGSQSLQAYVGYKFVALNDCGQCVGVADINQVSGEFAFDPIGDGDSGEGEDELEDNPQHNITRKYLMLVHQAP